MTTNPNLKRSRDFSTSNSTNEFDNISEDDESNSDTDYHISETESDDISTDELMLVIMIYLILMSMMIMIRANMLNLNLLKKMVSHGRAKRLKFLDVYVQQIYLKKNLVLLLQFRL
jgi:hypothetical protein